MGKLISTTIAEIMDLQEAADYLRISPDTLYKYAAAGFVPAFKLGNRWRFRRTGLDGWTAEQEKRSTSERSKANGA